MPGRSVLPPRRNADGVHLCTAADDCDAVAVVQWSVDCDGCQDVAADALAQVAEPHTHPVFACADHDEVK